MLSGSIPNSTTLLGVGGHRDEVLGDVGVAAELPGEPVAGRGGVGEGLLCGEGLGHQDEQRFGGVEVAGGLGDVGAVDVGHEAHGEVAVAEGPQRLVRHRGPKVGAADTNVDHVADALSRRARPCTGAHPVAEAGHPVKHPVHLGDHIDPVDDEPRMTGHPQGHVQHRTALGGVDPVAGEHGLEVLTQARAPGEGQE